MSTRRSEIRKDLLDALRGGNGSSDGEPSRSGNGADDRPAPGNGASLRDALKPRDRAAERAAR
ncbi:MAG: hypothetical protein ACRDL3_01355, partial [Solirubrobacterales bacterium]